jgi:hypothetical protein
LRRYCVTDSIAAICFCCAADHRPDVGHQEYFGFFVLVRSEQQPVIGRCLQIPVTVPTMLVECCFQAIAHGFTASGKALIPAPLRQWDETAENHVKKLCHPKTLTLEQRTNGAQTIVPVVVTHQGNSSRRKPREGAFDRPFTMVVQRFGGTIEIRDQFIENGEIRRFLKIGIQNEGEPQ